KPFLHKYALSFFVEGKRFCMLVFCKTFVLNFASAFPNPLRPSFIRELNPMLAASPASIPPQSGM
ncbi:hypothetical protein K0F18_22165, partial [Bacteroides fragilis]|nr:hypothetical protein [Bacteroides fragilis]MCE9394179.1 hypothetical protein [Bacteroides fragilis]